MRVCRVSGKTESFVVEGVSVEHDLVPLITSDIGVYGEQRAGGGNALSLFVFGPPCTLATFAPRAMDGDV